MKAICMLYQTPSKEVVEKVKGTAVKFEDRILTKDLANKYPGFLKNNKIGDTIKFPKDIDPNDLEMKDTFEMELEFVFPEKKTIKDDDLLFEELADLKKKTKDEGDAQMVLLLFIQLLVDSGWDLQGMSGSRYAFTKNC